MKLKLELVGEGHEAALPALELVAREVRRREVGVEAGVVPEPLVLGARRVADVAAKVVRRVVLHQVLLVVKSLLAPRALPTRQPASPPRNPRKSANPSDAHAAQEGKQGWVVLCNEDQSGVANNQIRRRRRRICRS